MTTLTYVIATENGSYNPTVPWGHLHTALSVYSRYKAVNFVRINDWSRASLRIVNARSLGSWAAYYRSSNTMKIHPTVDYGQNPTTLTKVIQHECGHFRRDGHHNSTQGIMHPGAGSVFNWRQIDDPWWSHRPWRSSLRPWQEPDYFKTVFATPRMMELAGDAKPTMATEDAKIQFDCQCNSLSNRVRQWFTPQPKIVSVAEATRSELARLAECTRCIHADR
jgi:predicted SprT family Zn-dependent metalloprotease